MRDLLSLDDLLLPAQVAPAGTISGVIKERPEDFRVDELSASEPSGTGDQLLVRLEKRAMTTDDLVAHVATVLGIDRRDIGVAGLKDKQAVTTYSAVLERDPSHAASYRHRGQLRFKLGHLEAAHGDYLRAIELGDPYIRTQAYVELIILDLARDKPQMAIQVLAEAGRAAPGLPVLDYHTGALSYIQGKFHSAYVHFGRALARGYDQSYCFLFAALATQHVKKIPHERVLRRVLANEKLVGWPKPLIEAYAGKLGHEQAWKSASNPAQQSEAGYFLGELALIDGKHEAARRYFTLAARSKSYRTIEKYLARLRLKK